MRSAALAKIHIARKDLGLTDDDYRAILTRIAGTNSAAKLGPDGHAKVLAEFRRLGWEPKQNGPKKSDKPGVRLIFGLWAEAGRRNVISHASRPALFTFVKRQTGIDNPEWLTPAQINSVVEALKSMVGRGR